MDPQRSLSLKDVHESMMRRRQAAKKVPCWQDLINQLFGWARIECEESGAINYGLPMRVRPVYRTEDSLWGFITSIMSRDGANLTDIRVM